MKVTGPTKLETKKIIAELEKQARKSGQALWLDLAERIAKPRRQRPVVNVWKIERLAKVLDKKILVVPGKVLGFGELSRPVQVVALEYAPDAKKKILEKGTAMTIREALGKKIKPREMAIVK